MGFASQIGWEIQRLGIHSNWWWPIRVMQLWPKAPAPIGARTTASKHQSAQRGQEAEQAKQQI